MSDSTTGTPALVIGAVALLGALAALLKIIKKSDCWGIHLETRGSRQSTPKIILAPPPSPTTIHRKTEENKIDTNIKECEV